MHEIFLSWIVPSSVISKNLLLYLKSSRFFSPLSSSFIVLHFAFRFIIHCELIS